MSNVLASTNNAPLSNQTFTRASGRQETRGKLRGHTPFLNLERGDQSAAQGRIQEHHVNTTMSDTAFVEMVFGQREFQPRRPRRP